MFEKNVGTIDRFARIAVGVLLILGFFLNGGDSAWRYLYLLGVIPLVSGIFQTCPTYKLLGISTCKTG